MPDKWTVDRPEIPLFHVGRCVCDICGKEETAAFPAQANATRLECSRCGQLSCFVAEYLIPGQHQLMTERGLN